MTALDIARLAVAAVPAVYWLGVSLLNLVVAGLAVLNRPSPSPAPVLGSVAGLLAFFIQPFSFGTSLPIALSLALLPDLAWWIGACLARLLDLFRTPRHRLT